MRGLRVGEDEDTLFSVAESGTVITIFSDTSASLFVSVIMVQRSASRSMYRWSKQEFRTKKILRIEKLKFRTENDDLRGPCRCINLKRGLKPLDTSRIQRNKGQRNTTRKKWLAARQVRTGATPLILQRWK